MGLWTRLKDFLSPLAPRARRYAEHRARFLGIREEDMPDHSERALYEAVINAAMQGGESIAIRGDGNTVTVNGEKYDSPEAARDAVKDKADG